MCLCHVIIHVTLLMSVNSNNLTRHKFTFIGLVLLCSAAYSYLQLMDIMAHYLCTVGPF